VNNFAVKKYVPGFSEKTWARREGQNRKSASGAFSEKPDTPTAVKRDSILPFTKKNDDPEAATVLN
jgi:hypothetical protein